MGPMGHGFTEGRTGILAGKPVTVVSTTEFGFRTEKEIPVFASSPLLHLGEKTGTYVRLEPSEIAIHGEPPARREKVMPLVPGTTEEAIFGN